MEQINDKFRTGIWYDMQNDDFAKIRYGSDDTVQLLNPETDSVYWDMSIGDWKEDSRYDFVEVPQDAVDDPREYIERAIRMMQRNDINELASVPQSFSIGLKWARPRVEISGR